ncbi:hypothetical protein [Anaeromyxobacter sp. Fw109-5]|uniref:hypothetical protein n=1 Tax=Anaeromyxobacter sp. (strain Fw109-5) TaxID=404589 RepID=UPI0002DF8B15|nr:hypothetical protein [Anaeromyxobacter sp. Fw109-5]
MNDSESEALSIAAEIAAVPPAPATVARRIRAVGDFLSQAIAVAFITALGAVTALAAVVVVTALAPLFFVLFVRAMRQHDRRLPVARAAA